MKLTEKLKELIPKELIEFNNAINTARDQGLKNALARFELHINAYEILILAMMGFALNNLFLVDTTDFPWHLDRQPAVEIAQRCSQFMGVSIERLDGMTGWTNCQVRMVCPTANYTLPDKYLNINRTNNSPMTSAAVAVRT